jgi:hypothetical protein
LDQLFWQYLCFAKHFLFFINLRMFLWQYGWWHHLSQTQLASCSPSSDLDSWNSCNCSIEMTKEPHLVWIIPRWLHEIYQSRGNKSRI